MLLSLKPCHICFPSVYFSARAALVQRDMPFCCHGIYTSKCARNQICKWRCHFYHTSRHCIYLFHVIFCGRSSSMDLVTEIWRDSVPPFFKDWWELLFEQDGMVKCYSELAPGVTIELMWGGFGEERDAGEGRGKALPQTRSQISLHLLSNQVIFLQYPAEYKCCTLIRNKKSN